MQSTPLRILAAVLLTGISQLGAESPEFPPPPSPEVPPLFPGVAAPPEIIYQPVGSTVAPATAVPATEKGGDNFWTRATLLGEWCGLRSDLREAGINFEGNLTQFGFGIGGGLEQAPPPVPLLPRSSVPTFAYTGRGDYAVTFDLEKFGGLPKGKLLVRAQHWFGDFGNVRTGSLPPAIFASLLPPVPNFEGIPYITDFVVTQPLSQNFVVYVGKRNVLGVTDQDDFAGGNGVDQFMNQAFVANPAFLLALPYTGFTAGVVSPQEWGSISAYVYDPKDRTRDFFRFDDLFEQGIIIGGELKVKTKFFDKPGEHHVGGIWKHVELPDLQFNQPPPGVYPYSAVPNIPTLGDSYTIYYGFDQYLQILSQETQRGWGLFGRASISDGNPTPVRYFLSMGIGGYSPIRHQKGDTFGIGFYYTGMSTEFGRLPRALLNPQDGWGVEMYYNVQVTPWMNLTPGFQIIQPEARAIANTAYIGGVRLNLKF